MIKHTLTALAIAALLAGCNTFKGAGKDVEKAGEKIQESSEKASDSIKKDN